MQFHWSQVFINTQNFMILPSFHFVSHRKHLFATSIIQCKNTMASCREISRLTTDMNTIAGTGRPSRNSQGICNTSQHSIGYNNPPLEALSILVNTQFSRSVLTENGPS